ncbi:DEAD/DEAH box helicase [Hymenobacter sediminis]|uniref:DEAD/DEAH box helicase n=1 Tax=Hymenobacter sediminis TaxID=2218621 RepID=UPI000DA6817C|nr:DEAD/DEAH box helicase [Hymenobacter sediminis]RPD45765.1 DEAD/DEAH box helicase [Hymenobacter sediminis]
MPNTPELPYDHQFTFPGLTIPDLTSAIIEQHHGADILPEGRALNAVLPEDLRINYGRFSLGGGVVPEVTVDQNTDLVVQCTCAEPTGRLCGHEALVLLALVQRRELRIFFDAPLRQSRLRAVARDYGLEQQPNLDEHFQLIYTEGQTSITPRQPELLPLTAATKQELVRQLLPEKRQLLPAEPAATRAVLLTRHRYYGHLTLQLIEAETTAAGKLRNPLTVLNPLDGIWSVSDPEVLKFYTGLARFQHNYEEERSAQALEALRAVVKNPLELPVYAHQAAQGEKPTAQSVAAVRVHRARLELRLLVTEQGEFYRVSGQLSVLDQLLALQDVTIRYDYFVALHNDLYLLDDLDVWRVVEFFKKRSNTLLLHQSKFPEFQQDVLAGLEDKLHIHYTYVRPATPQQLALGGYQEEPTPLLYLSEAGAHVEVLPVMRYGEREVSVLSRKQLQDTDALGQTFAVTRDAAAETRLLKALMRHYPHFEEQLHLDALYVPKKQFLDEDWFLEAFKDWRTQGITILGFNQLKGNNLNPHKAHITVQVSRETNWFDTKLGVRFGKQQASLPQLYQAVRNQRRYVTLDDGTRGILPQEWLDKFTRYFAAAEVVEEQLRTPAVNFAAVEELYQPEELTPEARAQLADYRAALADFGGIQAAPVPAGLQATLRDYQRQGLNWLNFLDTFQFGGCLADDMGLGKTLQVLAFLLLQREKGERAASLVVVPTSLVFNWQAEVAKFAPTLRVHTLHGASRIRHATEFDGYDIVLTTYGTLVADVRALQSYQFNYVILDEAQAIKNPDSQRYKAARRLQARNRLVLTGTPLENNTYDIYGLLSFACPGLLGSRAHFKAHFATRTDKFKDDSQARALQQKIRPFVLRRTKAQVAPELPDKTEMVLYCDMGPEQRRVYEACKEDYRNLLLGRREDVLGKDHMHLLQGLTRLRQICNSPALLTDGPDYGAASAKLEVLLEELQNHAPQHKILIFSQFVGMLDLIRPMLEAHDIPYQQLTGQTRHRAAAVQEFQQNEQVRVFLISLKAGGTGLNLTEADYVYLVDPWWNPAVENQAIDRAYRIGQTKKVVAVRLICPRTVEEKIMQLQQTKRELAQDLIRTDAALLKTLSKQELLELFA